MQHIEKDDGTIIQSGDDELNEYLTQYPYYVGYATDVGRIKNGKKTGEEALTIFVSEKKEKKTLNKKQLIPSSLPKEIHGLNSRLRTDVVEIGVITAPPTITNEFRATSDRYRYEKNRPFKAGVSIGNIKISAGTHGGVFIANGKKVVGTNTHVGCESIRKDLSDQDRRVLQPGPYDDGKEADQFGTLKKAVIMPEGKVAFNDFCYIEPENQSDLDPEIYETGIPHGITTIEVDDLVYKSGRTTGFTTGKVLSTSATVNIGYGEGRVTHKACILVSDMSDGGDSGSLMTIPGDKGEILVWGYLFAGSDTTTVCHEIQNAMSALGISLYVEDMEPDPPEDKVFRLDFELEPLNNGKYKLRGVVWNKQSGMPIPNAIIMLQTQEAGFTSEDGVYEIDGLTPATYKVTAVKEFFKPQTKMIEITNTGRLVVGW